MDGRRVAWAIWGGGGGYRDLRWQSDTISKATYRICGFLWHFMDYGLKISGLNMSIGIYLWHPIRSVWRPKTVQTCLNHWSRGRLKLPNLPGGSATSRSRSLQDPGSPGGIRGPQELVAEVANHRLLFRIFAGRPGELVGAHRSAPSCKPFLSVWRLCALMAFGWLECNLFGIV
jgi:hypothetical protein